VLDGVAREEGERVAMPILLSVSVLQRQILVVVGFAL
jgi:hypothetical protein